MNIVQYFLDWKKEREEKVLFMEMWMEEYGELIGTNNTCQSYHQRVAYELFKLTKRIEELESKVNGS